MTVTLAVVMVALAAGVISFAVSASRSLDPAELDPVAPARRMPRVRRYLAERVDRTTMRGLFVTVAFAVVLAVAVALGLLLDMVATGEGLAEHDDDVAAWGSQHATSGAVEVLRVITQFGSTWLLSIALAMTALVAWLHSRSLVPPAFLAVVGLGQVVLVNLLKVIVDRDRPDVLQLVDVRGPSFPSGHSTAAAACWLAVAIVLGTGRTRRVQALFVALAVVIAVAVAASRALLGVHWLTDVVAGLALGWGWCVLVVLAFRLSASPDRRRS